MIREHSRNPSIAYPSYRNPQGGGYTPRRMPQPTPRALVTTQAGIESFTVSPAGALVIYARRVVAGESYRSHLWSVSRAGGRPRRLTSGAVRDAAPAISPDGSSVAFIRAPSGDPDAKPQVWLLPLTGRRRPWQLTRRRDGAAHPVWSPSGSLIAFLGEAGEDRFAVGLDPRRPKRLPTARHMNRLDYRDDESGLLGRRTHLWLVAPRRGARPWPPAPR